VFDRCSIRGLSSPSPGTGAPACGSSVVGRGRSFWLLASWLSSFHYPLITVHFFPAIIHYLQMLSIDDIK
jgi:hypothetical protein